MADADEMSIAEFACGGERGTGGSGDRVEGEEGGGRLRSEDRGGIARGKVRRGKG